MISRVTQTIERVAFALGMVAGWCLFILGAAMAYEVVMRYFLNKPGPYVYEMGIFATVIITYLAASYTERQAGHIKVDLIYSIVSDKVGSLLNAIGSFIALIYVVLLAWAGCRETIRMYAEQWVSDTMVRTPLAPIAFVVCVGLLVFISIIIIRLISFIKSTLKT
jgi:TRAP-type mannitol/chloroaromatic compound transport system permease small subunit